MPFLLFIALLVLSPFVRAEESCDVLLKQVHFDYDPETNSFHVSGGEKPAGAQEFGRMEMKLSREAREEWELSERLSHDVDEIFGRKDLSDREKRERFFSLMNASRLEMLEEKAKDRVLKSNADSKEGRSIYSRTIGRLLARYAGPHYAPLLNRVGKASGKLDDVSESLASTRLLEQSIQRNSKPSSMIWTFMRSKEALMAIPTPATPLGTFNMEARAMGAQWEAVSRMPLIERQKLLARLRPEAEAAKLEMEQVTGAEKLNPVNFARRRSARVHSLVRDVTIAALENAHLPKEHFLREVMPVHHYRLGQLLKKHYAGTWRLWMLGLSGGALGLMAVSDRKEDKEFYKDKVPAADLKFFYDKYKALIDDDDD